MGTGISPPSQNGGNSTAELYFEKTNQLIKNNKD